MSRERLPFLFRQPQVQRSLSPLPATPGQGMGLAPRPNPSLLPASEKAQQAPHPLGSRGLWPGSVST